MSIEDQLAHHAQSLDKLLSCVYELRAEVAEEKRKRKNSKRLKDANKVCAGTASG